MQVQDSYIENDGDKREAVVELAMSGAEVKPYIDAYYAELGQNEVPGFRRGKAPREVLERGVGGHDQALAQIAQRVVDAEAFAAIDDAGIVFLGDPEFSVNTPPDAETGFSLSASGPVAPEVSLSSAEPVAIEMPPDTATDAEVDRQIETLRACYYSYEDIDDPAHEAADGDFVLLSMTVEDGGRVVNGLKDTRRMIGLGTGTMPAGFDAALVGSRAGDELEFDFEAGDPGAQADSAVAGAEQPEQRALSGTLHARVKVEAFRRRIEPALDDAFAAKLGAADPDDLRKQVRISINMQKAEQLPELMQQRCLDALAERIEGELPDYYVNHMREAVQFEFMQNLREQNTNLQDFILNNNMDGDDLKRQFADEAMRRARYEAALEALWQAKGWDLTDADLDAAFSDTGDAAELRRSWEEAHRMAELRRMCRQNKATRWLVDTAQVEVVEGDGEDAA